MQRWGLVVTIFYALVVVFLLVPGAMALSGGEFLETIADLFDVETIVSDDVWLGWLVLAIVICAQAILLFVSVDTRFKRTKPRAHVALSIGTVAFAVGLLCFAAGVCVYAAIVADDFVDEAWFWFGVPVGLWLLWAFVFYLYRSRFSAKLENMVGWLLNGSVLQLLIAVPCHLIVRHRNDCSAPAVTGFGIATGVALMLMAFGPSVYFLYRRKLGEYASESGPPPLLARWPIRTVAGVLAIGGLTLFLALPYEGPAMAGGDIANVADSAEEIAATLEDYAAELGMQIQAPRESFFVMYCSGRVVANFVPTEDSEAGTASLSYRTYFEPFSTWGDYTRFTESVELRLEAFGEPLGIRIDRPHFMQRLKGRLHEGSLTGRGCDWSPD